MLIPEEKHEGHWVVEFVHLLEVRYLVEVADVEDGKVFDPVGDAVEDFVLSHAIGVPIATEANYDEPLFFRHDGLVNVPVRKRVREVLVRAEMEVDYQPVTRWGKTTEPMAHCFGSVLFGGAAAEMEC